MVGSGFKSSLVGSLALGLALILAAGGCAGDPARPAAGTPPRVALIGWDGAAWEVIDPLLRDGRLPHLQRLLDRGCRAVLRAERPLFSPVVWTTLATGFPASEHGITDFQLPELQGEGLVLASSLHRRRAPLWRMVSTTGKRAGLIGWWTTWPADPVNGYVVSDHLAYNRWDAWARRSRAVEARLTFPPELSDELRPHAVPPETLGVETLTTLVPFNASEQREMMTATKPIMFHAPSVLRFGYATDASNASFARYLLETREQPDLFAVVFILTDVAGHVFWHHYEPERYPARRIGIDDDHLREAIPRVYEQVDRWTGEILERLDPETIVIVLSDHGMGPKDVLPRPGVTPAGDHTPDGILVVSGAQVPSGADLGVIPALDLAPTVLALLDLPLAEDMPGSAVASLLPGGQPPRTVATYGDGRSGEHPAEPSPAAADYEERLRSLGYIK